MTKQSSNKASTLRTKCSKEKEDLSLILDDEGNAESRALIEALIQAPDFQGQILLLQKWLDCEKESSFLSALGSLFFRLPLKSSLRRFMSSRIRDLPHDSAELFACFLKELKSHEGESLVINVLKCFDDNNPFLSPLAGHLHFEALFSPLAEGMKAQDDGRVSNALRAISYARTEANRHTVPSSLDDTLHCIIQSSEYLSSDTKGKAAKILFAQEMSRRTEEDFLLNVAQLSETPSSPYYCSDPEHKFIYLHGVITSTSSPRVLRKILHEEYLNMTSGRDLSAGLAVNLSRGILRCVQVLLPQSGQEDTESIEEYIWSYLEHPLSTVRYNVKDTFREVIKMRHRTNSLEDTIIKVLGFGATEKRRPILLSQIIKIGGPQVTSLILERDPYFRDGLIDNLSDSALRSPPTELYKTCVAQIKDSEFWPWLKPVLEGYKSDVSNVCRKDHLDIIFKEIVKRCDGSLGDTLVNDIIYSGEEKSPSSLCIAIQSLKTMKLFKKSKFQFDNEAFIQECLTNVSDEVRLEALDLITASLKTTEVLDEKELSLIFELGLKANMYLSDAPLIMHFLGIMKKFLFRLHESFGALHRSNNESAMVHYQIFIDNIKKWIIIDNLSRPNVHLAFRTISFELLSLCCELLSERRLFSLSSQEGRTLVNCLKTETHDKNSEVILGILRKSFGGKGEGHGVIDFSSPYIIELVRSPRPRNNVIAQYCVTAFRITCGEDSDFENALLNEFKTQVHVARVSLVKASYESPLYGILGCLKGGPLLEKVLEDCYELWGLVSPIVNDSSPEGVSLESSDSLTCDPQILLLLAWRSAKEICHILEATASLPGADILRAAKFFVGVFSDTQHKGVFERAYSGFVSLCKILWNHKVDDAIQEYPHKLLEDTLSTIGSVSEDANITRRSAGYPFLIQALLSTQPGYKSFGSTMETLLDWSLSDFSHISLKVHACNILRTIYRDAGLGDKVMKYVAKGFQTSIRGFNSDVWPIRNASTLLFSSLVTRLFGVKVDTDDLSSRNGLYTFKVFYDRFPELVDFLYSQLNDKYFEEGGITLKTKSTAFPCLLLLVKLKKMTSPSSADMASKIQKFREVVMTFLFHPELKIRHLAAYALCTLTTDEDIPSLTHSLIEKVPQVPHANALHGILYALNLIAPKDSTLLDNLELYLQDIPVALSCPIILTEVLRLLNVPKDSLIKELLQIKAQKFPHPGKALYERALIQKSLSFIRDSKDHDLASFLIEECQSLYFEVLNETKMSDLGGFALGLNESNMAQRICSLEDLHEFSIVLKLFVSGAELDSGCRFIWERLTFFFLGSPRESTYGKTSSSLTCIAIRAMTKYVNSFSPSHSDLVAWSNFLRRLACSPEESIRREIMDSISESSSYLSQLRDPKEAVVSLSLWFTLMTFSFEEDYPIKCSLLRILKHLRGTTPIQGPLLPNLIHVELCKWLIEHSTLFLAETRSVLLEAYDEIMNRNSPDGMETEASSLAFEKGDESIRFGELQAVQKLIEDHYKSSLNQGINDFKLQGFYSMKKMA